MGSVFSKLGLRRSEAAGYVPPEVVGETWHLLHNSIGPDSPPGDDSFLERRALVLVLAHCAADLTEEQCVKWMSDFAMRDEFSLRAFADAPPPDGVPDAEKKDVLLRAATRCARSMGGKRRQEETAEHVIGELEAASKFGSVQEFVHQMCVGIALFTAGEMTL